MLKSILLKIRIAFKGLYQTISIRAKLSYYRLFATEINDLQLATAKLHARGAKWLPGKPVKVFAIFSISNWEINLVDALNTIGPVTHFTWPHVQDFFNDKKSWLTYRNQLNAQLQLAFETMYDPEVNILVFLYASDFTITARSLDVLKRENVVTVNFCWDDLLYFKASVHGQAVGIDQISRKVDLNLSFSPEALPRYHYHKTACFFWEALPVPLIEPVSTPAYHTENRETGFYVLFIGSRYGWRGEFINKLRSRGIPVKCFGNGWENGSIDNDQMNKEIRMAPVTLGFANAGYTKNITTIKGRDFEVPILGGLYLTQYSAGLKRYYVPGKEMLTYHSSEECYEIICQIRENKNWADTIRAAGHQKAIRYCSWNARMKFLSELVNNIATKQSGTDESTGV